MKIYKVKVGEGQWALGGSSSRLTTNPAKAKVWKTKGYAKAHITSCIKREKWYHRNDPNWVHSFESNPPEIQEYDLFQDTDKMLILELPTKDLEKLQILSDYLEEIGFKEASESIRSKLHV